MDTLFQHQQGLNRRKEKALRMISNGETYADICMELNVSFKTLQSWIKAGGAVGDPELDQVSLIDGLTERERKN